MYGAFRKLIIQRASDIQKALLKYLEESEKQQEHGDFPSDALSAILS